MLKNNSALMRISVILKRFVGTNLVWVVFNIPMLVLIYYWLTLDQVNPYFLIVAGAVIFILFSFPATTAMFGVLRKYVMGEEVPIIESFLQHYRENYRRSLVGGVLFSLLWLILGYGYYLFADTNQLIDIILLILTAVLIILMFNFISISVHLTMALQATIKSTFLITIGGPVLTGILGALSLALIYVSTMVFPVLMLLFAGSIIAHINFYSFYRVIVTMRAMRNVDDVDDQDDDLE